MNEVKNNQPAVVAPSRAVASSKGNDSAQVKVVDTGNALPVKAPESSSVKAEKRESSATDVNRAVARMNEFIQKEQRNLQFSVDDTTGSTVVRVTDSKSGELIRQIPNEVFLDLAKHAIKDEQINLISVYS
jgi:flagellar protein FlaG